MNWLLDPINWLMIGGVLAVVELVLSLEVTYFGAAIGAGLTSAFLRFSGIDLSQNTSYTLLIFCIASAFSIFAMRYLLAKPTPVERFDSDINDEAYKADKIE